MKEKIIKFFKDWVREAGVYAVMRELFIIVVVAYIIINFMLTTRVVLG